MEYMAMGKAVIVSQTSDMHKIIVDGENGVTFKPEDKEGFVEAMGKLVDAEFRTKVGRNAYTTASTGYTWDIQGKIFLD